jgi:serine/threonine protein kinase
MQTCPHCLQPLATGAQVCPACGVPLPTPLELPPNTLLKSGDYRLERVLGRGGFGITYLALDTRLKRQVAIKEFFPEGCTRTQSFVYNPNTQDFLESKQRFLEEARVLARFVHAGIVRVFDVFEDNNTAYLVMEALQGKTLGKALESGAILPKDVEKLAKDLCATLEVVHTAGWLHRDIKPDNVFITQDDRVVLIDFGSARVFQSKRTMRHTRLVTPGYAAPEQFASSAQFGAFTDMYGLAATLHHALTGNPPPSATDRFVGTRVPSLGADVPIGLKQAVEQGLALKVNERPQSARDFLRLVEGKTTAVTQLFTPPIPKPKKPVAQTFAQPQSRANPTPIRFQRDNLRISDSEIILSMMQKAMPYDLKYSKNDIRELDFLEKKRSPWLFVWLAVFVGSFLITGLGVGLRFHFTIIAFTGFSALVALVLAKTIEDRQESPIEYDVLITLSDGSNVEIYKSSSHIQAREVHHQIQKFLA